MLEPWIGAGHLNEVLWPVVHRMFISFICGAIVGAEREWKGKAAGLRTNILICLGATLFTLASELAAVHVARAPQEATRITAQIVTGVGFLGAGAILRSGHAVVGLTTAATIWLVSAIGVIVGIGFPAVGLIAAVLTVATLVALGRLEKRIMGPCDMRTLELHVGANRPVEFARLEAILGSASWPARVENIRSDEKGTTITFSYCVRHPSHQGILWELEKAVD